MQSYTYKISKDFEKMNSVKTFLYVYVYLYVFNGLRHVCGPRLGTTSGGWVSSFTM